MMSYKFKNKTEDFIQRLKRSSLSQDVVNAIELDIASTDNSSRLAEEYEGDFSLPLSMLPQKSPFFLPDESIRGKFKLGVSENGLDAGVNNEECHFMMAGQTGCGKSTLLKYIFSQALKDDDEEKIVCWLFVKAQDMRPLLKVSKDVLVVTFNEIKINPLEPVAGMKDVEWASIFADIWIQASRLFEGSKGFLMECLNSLYLKHKDTGYCPSLFDLYYYVKSLHFSAISRTARYQESILNRLGGLIFGSLGDVFNCSRGHTSDLINNHAIFEILYLTSEQQVFTVNYFLSYLFYHKMINESNLRHFAGIDDANLIFDKSLEERREMGLPIIHHLLTTVRKNKINIFCSTQTPHQLGASIHSNSFAKIMFSLSNGKDLEFMFQSAGIKDEEQRAYCYKLKPREMVIKFSSRYQEPFVAVVPEVEL
jgi:type IV secretory pathway VirB4 component